MKIIPEHYAYMARAVSEIATTRNLGEFEAKYRLQGLTPKRFRWDCAHDAGLIRWFCDNVYPYANDDHIDTALRRLMAARCLTWAARKE